MGSIYSAVLGESPNAARVLEMLGLTNVPRYRDAFIDPAGFLVLYTRGGTDGSAPILWAMPGFLSAQTGAFDASYLTAFFAIPAKHADEVAAAIGKGEGRAEKPEDGWARVVAEIKSGALSEKTQAALGSVNVAVALEKMEVEAP
jgi:hypothetical protein